MRRFVCVLLLLLFANSGNLQAATPTYRIPVNAPITKRFSAPANYYAAGNRGVEFGVDVGQSVYAAANGKVSFAGKVAGKNFVTIQHLDGVRTTYSYLKSVIVHRGEAVVIGKQLGTTGSQFQWGARIGAHAYVDPLQLVDGASNVHLVEDDHDVATLVVTKPLVKMFKH